MVLFCVKLYDTEEAARACLPLLSDHSVLIPIQNGVESVERVAAIVGANRVLGGTVLTNLHLEKPGVFVHMGKNQTIKFGSQHLLSEPFHTACVEAGLDAFLVDDVQLMHWWKFSRLAANSAISGITRKPLAQVRDIPQVRETLIAAIAEVVAVGRALDVPLAQGFEAEVLAGIDDLPWESKSSLLLDLEKGKRLEVEWLSGAVHRLGQRAGVPTPVHSTMYAALLPFANGAGE